jgi:hypothetical protein
MDCLSVCIMDCMSGTGTMDVNSADTTLHLLPFVASKMSALSDPCFVLSSVNNS